MFFILLVLAVLPAAFALSVLAKKPFEEALPVVLLGTLAMGYFLALAGLAWLAPYVFLAAALAACGYLVYALFVRRSAKLLSLVTPGFAAFLLLAAALWWLCRGRMLVSWDDFSHWGAAIKTMYYSDRLYTAPDSIVIFKDYPPATVVLQYVLLKAVHAPYREDLLLFINGLFAAGLLVYPLSKFGWKRAGLALVCAGCLFLVPAAMNTQNYTRLLVDGLMGVILAYLLLVAYFAHRNRFAALGVMLGCFTLSITKAAGMGLATMAALVVLGSVLLDGRAALQAFWRESRGLCLAWTAGPFAAILAGALSWSAHKQVLGILPAKVAAPVLPGIFDMLAGNAPAWRYKAAGVFAQMVFASPEEGRWVRFPPVCWLAVFAVLFLGVWFLCKKEERKRAAFFFGAVASIYIVFMASLFISYLFVFGEYEALELSSFFRYESTVSISGILLLLGALFVAAQERPLWARAVAGAAAVACIFAVGADSMLFAQDLLRAPVKAAETQHERYLSLRAAQRVRALGEETPRLQLVSITDDGFALMRLDYELLPITLSEPGQRTSVAVAPYYGENTAASTDIYTPGEWLAQLDERFDYVYLHNIDSYFVEGYKHLFSDEARVVNDTMWRVVREADGNVVLQEMELTPIS